MSEEYEEYLTNRVQYLEKECETLHTQLMETERYAQERILALETELEEWQGEAKVIKKGIESCVDLQDMHKKIENLEDRHQSDCIEINRLNTTIEVLADKYSRLRQQMGL